MPDTKPLLEERENERLQALSCAMLLDTPPSESFDQITRLASQLFEVPVSLVSLIDADRQWFKSRVGLLVQETDRKSSFCSHAIQRPDVMVVEDARLDPRFVDNPLVTGEPHIRFYAGAPLVVGSGHALGSLCVIDHRVRTFSVLQRQQLAILAALTVTQIELHQRAGRINAVTGLANRVQLFEDLEKLAAVSTVSKSSLMLLEVMDHQRMLVESRTVGVAPLEALSRAVTVRLKRLLHPGTDIYHVGEMRFCFTPAGESRDEKQEFALSLLAELRDPIAFDGRSMELEPAAGLLEFELNKASPADALRMAGAALHARSESEAAYAWHDPALDAAQRRAYRLMREISPGLARGEFRLVYQPKLNLRTGSYSGVESLARWHHPELGDISPGEFIPLVESGALIHEFTRWALRNALAQLAKWRTLAIDVTMAVNVSSRNLDEKAFVAAVQNICVSSNIAPRFLHVECTENAVMTSARTQTALEEIREMGAQISLDDFGMGFSNLACLRRLPVEMLKLDQSLIKPIDSEARAWELVKSLVRLGHSLGYKMLAEGVETRQALDLLATAGCDEIQGFYLSRPLEADAIPSFLKNPPIDPHSFVP